MHKSYRNSIKMFEDRLRVRVCGICIQDNRILMVKHRGLSSKGYFWAPPGGGMEFGQSAEENLIREFKEETGLDISIKRFLFIYEFLKKPLHAIELFFEVEVTGGKLKKGHDPELETNNQILEDVTFWSTEDLIKEKGPQLHQAFHRCKHPADILSLEGYLKFEK